MITGTVDIVRMGNECLEQTPELWVLVCSSFSSSIKEIKIPKLF
jgi:hypothetical protein